MNYVLKLKNNTWGDGEENLRKAEEMNRKIFLMRRFRYLFRGYEELNG
jgi:hypothetical protein